MSCSGTETDPLERQRLQGEVERFLDDYERTFLALNRASQEAEWRLNTFIVEGDDSAQKQLESAKGELSRFTGSVEVIERTRTYLSRAEDLRDLQRLELRRVLYRAADNPEIVSDLVTQRIQAEAEQTRRLFGFDYKLDGRSVSTNDLDRELLKSRDLAERLKVWNASKEVGVGLKQGLERLVGLRNQTVRALGYRDFFEYQVSDYGMTVDEMKGMMRRLMREIWPLYRELHTFARYELARRYGVEEVPELLPAHWLPNRWGQAWPGLIEVEGFDIEGILSRKLKEWFVEQAERFYVSVGFAPLPKSFFERSSLYPAAPDAGYRKNNHASAWHVDLSSDVRCLMSIEPNAEWYETTHHELGHIYYYLCYSRPEVPAVLREGANRAFHEAIGSLLGLASMQKAFLQGLGLLSKDAASDPTQALFREALDMVVFIPFSAGTMTHFEHDLYATDLSVDQYNSRWWQYVRQFQGIVPPGNRGEAYCDGATKTHINDDPAQYYDYALSFILLHQIHAHIARNILHQDPHDTNYFGNKEVGAFLRRILSLGATRDWRQVMREFLGEEISARPMVEYFAPLIQHLEKINQGRACTLQDP